MGIVKDIIARASIDRIVKGGDYDIAVQLLDRVSREPLNLTGASGGSAQFAGADGNTVTLSWAPTGVSLLDATVGFVNVHVGSDTSALLAAGADQSWELEVHHGQTTIAQLVEALDVEEQLY